MATPKQKVLESERSDDFARAHRRRQLIDATIDAIAEYGLSKITLAKVARAADLSPGIVNFYFKSKEQLLVETLRDMAREFDAVINRGVANPEDPVECLQSLVDAYFDPRIFNLNKVAVWNAYWGETQARTDYLAICGDRDAELSARIRALFEKLCGDTRSVMDPTAAARGFEGMLDGFWQDLLYDAQAFDTQCARKTCLAYLRNLFPDEFAAPIDAPSVGNLPPRTLMAPWTYRNGEFFDLEIERLFKRHWLPAGHVSDLPEPGDYSTFDAVGERVILVRGADREIRAFHNVCRHRGSRIVAGDRGNCRRAIVCPFHGWTYHLDGSLKNVPASHTFHKLDKDTHGLVTLDMEIWHGFIFVRFGGDGPAIHQTFAHIEHRVAPYKLPNVQPIGPAKTEVHAVNWKVIHDIDNEGYHVPIGHPGLHALFGKDYHDGSEGGVDVSYGRIQDKPARQWSVAGYQKLLPKYDHLPEGHQRLWLYFGLFPNAVFELHPDCVSYYMTLPVSPDKTMFIERYFALPDHRPEARAARYLSQRINRQTGVEDRAYVGWIQEGLRSSVFPEATLSSMESGVSDFHRKVQERLPVGRLADAPKPGTVADINARMMKETGAA